MKGTGIVKNFLTQLEAAIKVYNNGQAFPRGIQRILVSFNYSSGCTVFPEDSLNANSMNVKPGRNSHYHYW